MSLAELGYAVVEQSVTAETADRLIELTKSFEQSGRGGARNLMAIPAIRELSASAPFRDLVRPVLGPDSFAVRALYFDKTPDANWKVPWHQDLTVAVHKRVSDEPGYGARSVKAGVPHVEPPVSVLEQMLAVRIHLDDCGPMNGPLRVIPGSHKFGRLTADQQSALPKDREVSCTIRRGDVILLRPLLLHASSAAQSPAPRRVVHIEYAGCNLPGNVEWQHGRLHPAQTGVNSN